MAQTEGAKIHFHFTVKKWENLKPKEYFCADLHVNFYEHPRLELRVNMGNGPKSKEFADSLLNNEIDNVIGEIDVKTDNYFDLDFSNSEILYVYLDSNVDYIKIHITEVKYKWNRPKPSIVKDHFFFLTNSADNLAPISFSMFSANGSWVDKSKRKKRGFLSSTYQFTNEFYRNEGFRRNSNELIIRKIPILKIRPNLRNNEKSVHLIHAICLLSSFYLGRTIQWYMSIVNEDTFQEITVREIQIANSNKKISRTNFHNVEDFIKAVTKKDLFLQNIQFWDKTIEKYLLASELSGESKFMLLYNILEQAFVYLKQVGKITIKYRKPYFSELDTKKKEINNLCRKLVSEISLLIPRAARKDISDFDRQNSNIAFKDQIIIKRSQDTSKRKIQLLLKKLRISSSQYEIDDLQELVKLRDNIIHPSINSDIDPNSLKTVNQNLFNLVNDVIMLLLNPNNLKKRKKC